MAHVQAGDIITTAFLQGWPGRDLSEKEGGRSHADVITAVLLNEHETEPTVNSRVYLFNARKDFKIADLINDASDINHNGKVRFVIRPLAFAEYNKLFKP